MAEYTTEEKVEAELLTTFTGTTSPNTAQIATFIAEAQELIDRRTGTTFGTAAFTDEILDLNEDNTFSSSIAGLDTNYGRNDYLFDSVGRRDLFFLPFAPIVSMSSLEVNGAGASGIDDWQVRTEQTGSSGDFQLNKDEGSIIFMTNFPRSGKRSIKTSGVYGHATIPGVVSELATKITAQRVLGARIKKSQTTSVDSISLEGISIRKNIGQTTQYLQTLNADVQELWATVGDLIVDVV